MKRNNRERGQVVILALVAMAIFVFGALGLAIDGANLYLQRQMAQAAADAAAQAAMMSIFNHSNTSGPSQFPTTAFTCSTTSMATPCVYARNNGFGATAADTVTIDYPDASVVPGISLSEVDPVNLVRATVTRQVDTTLMRLLGPTSSMVRAVAIAAILNTISPVPIIVTHPTRPASFAMNGNLVITICGGPARSIQVNSNNSVALEIKGNPLVNLSKAGPLDAGNCTTGTGADFGSYGGPSGPSSGLSWMSLGTTGKYIQPASPIEDPLRDVSPPAQPSPAPPPQNLANGVSGCPAAPLKPCKLYSPGAYDYILVQNETAVFKPGLYYITSYTKLTGNNVGFGNASNGEMMMSQGFPDVPDFGQGMMVYNAGGGSFQVGANSGANLVGSDPNGTYKGILFFQSRNAPALEHRLGGGGGLVLKGTIYLTHERSVMESSPSTYQNVLLQGTPGQQTLIIGQIIVGTLQLGGNATITMQLDPAARYIVRRVALVK